MNLKNKTEMRKELIFYKKNYNNLHAKMIKILDYIKAYNETKKNADRTIQAIENLVIEKENK